MNPEDIFHKAIEISDQAERVEYLDKACAGDEKLRAEVDALLKWHEEAGSFLKMPEGDPNATLENAPVPDASGTVVGRYKLLEKIGEGGMASVYMAEQERPIRRFVAVKLIKLGMDSKEVIARFEAERQALALMDHPNIAKVFDAGTTDTGRPYFVMELVRGITITEYCDVNNLNPKERLELFLPVCQATQHAHQKGIIHRDIKPSNVLVTMHDGIPVPKMIDFGIAKAVNQRLTEKTLFTRYAQMIGTPEYMSPEQAEMSALGIDTRTDVYSLGVLLYELLTGTTPFDAEELRSKGYAEMQKVIREKEPLRPSTKISTLGSTMADVAKRRKTNPESLTKLVKGDLDWIVMKSLEKDRTRRYETAHALAEDIRRHMANEPISAGSPTVLYSIQKFYRKHKRQIVTAAAFIIVGVVSILALAKYHQVAKTVREREQVLAVQEAKALLSSAQGFFAGGKYEQAMNLLEPLTKSEHVSGDAWLLHARLVLQMGKANDAVKELEGMLGEPAEIASQAHLLLARIYLDSAQSNIENPLFFQDKAKEHQTKGEAMLPNSAQSYYNRALMARSVNETLRWLNRSLELQPDYYNALKTRAITNNLLEKYDEVEGDASIMIALSPSRSDGYALRAIAKRKKGADNKDRPLLNEAIKDFTAAIAKSDLENPALVEYYNERRKTYVELGDFSKALEDAKACAKESPENLEYQFNIFSAHIIMGNLNTAEIFFDGISLSNPMSTYDFYGWSEAHTFAFLDKGLSINIPPELKQRPAFYPITKAIAEYKMISSKFSRFVSPCRQVDWSPAGKEIVYFRGLFPESTIEVLNLESGHKRMLATGIEPHWSPDGKYVAFTRNTLNLSVPQIKEQLPGMSRMGITTGFEVCIIQPDGEGLQLLTSGWVIGWKPNSQEVYYVIPEGNHYCLMSIDITDQNAEPRQIMTLLDFNPAISSDGRYLSSLDGWYTDIREMETGNVVHKLKIPKDFVNWGYLSWSPDGRYLFSSGPVGAESGLWITDMKTLLSKKVLNGIDARVSFSPEMRHMVLSLDFPYMESWIIDLDQTQSVWDQFDSIMTIEEHWMDKLDEYALMANLYPAPFSLASLAALQANCPIVKYRDGEKAVLNATRAIELLEHYDPKVIEIYWFVAEAYAACEDYDSALIWINKAIEGLATDPRGSGIKILAPYLIRLKECYEQGKSYFVPYSDE